MTFRSFVLLSICTITGCSDTATPTIQPVPSADREITAPKADGTDQAGTADQKTTRSDVVVVAEIQATSPEIGTTTPTPPKFNSVEVFIFNKTYIRDGRETGTSSCTTKFSPQPRKGGASISKTASTCGFSPKVARVTWQYTRTDDEGDHYEFERTFPKDDPNATTKAKKVVYAGTELLLFEDAFQRIVMRPSKR